MRSPLAKQVDEQNDCVAFSTVASQAQRAPVQVMLGAAALAEEPLAAAWTFVHCVGHQQPLALELFAEDSRIQTGLRLVT